MRLHGLSLDALENRARPASPGGINRQGDGRDHESHRRPGRGFGERAGRAAGTERCLATLAAESRGNIATLAALQENNDDDEETNEYVDGRNQVNHKLIFS